MIESCPHSISRRDLSVQGMHFRQRQRLRTLEYNNKKKKKGTVRRGSWKTHHKISTFLRRVCLSSRQVRVNLKREGSVGQTVEGTFFKTSRKALFDVDIRLSALFQESLPPRSIPRFSRVFCIRVCVTCLRKQVSIQPRRDRFRSTPRDVLLIEKSTMPPRIELCIVENLTSKYPYLCWGEILQCFYFYETNSLVEFFETSDFQILLNHWLEKIWKKYKNCQVSRE